MQSPMTSEELERYATAVVRGAISLRRGDDLIVRANPGHRELVVAIAEAAYTAGARYVEPLIEDPRVTAARIVRGRTEAIGYTPPWQVARARAIKQERTAVIQIIGEFEADVLGALPPERVAEDTKRRLARSPLRRARAERRQRTAICAWPTPEWAARVYPELTEADARRALAADLLRFCRLGPGDPAGYKGWTTHLTALRRRSAKLTRLALRELELRGDGTELRFRLSPEGVWRGGGETTRWGHRVSPNIPTEENFTSPEAAATEGIFRCSRPRHFGGRVIEGLAGEFRRGRLVRLEASRDEDRDWLARFIGSIPNADRIGEVALVDSTSRVGQTGRVYHNTLLDENATAHIAFGRGFDHTRVNPTARGHRGVNQSRTHIDVMIGTDDLEAVAVTATGRRVTLLREGLWQI
jgi:aminopeptidase